METTPQRSKRSQRQLSLRQKKFYLSDRSDLKETANGTVVQKFLAFL